MIQPRTTVTILCNDESHPINDYLLDWITNNEAKLDIKLLRDKSELSIGDFLFLVSCSQIVTKRERSGYKNSLVLHASNLPQGRGWSPHIWDIISGSDCIYLCLLEAEDKVDTGKIWLKQKIDIPKTCLWNEINEFLFTAEINMIHRAVYNSESIVPYEQNDKITGSYYRKRIPEDSQLDIEKTLKEQFDIMRVCDPHRFPAWFELDGKKFKLILEKFSDEND